MKGKQYDCVVAPAASTEFAFLKTTIPSVYISDATFELMSNYYEKEFKNTCSLSLWEGNLLEKRSLQKASFIIHCSYWAEHSAVDYYKIPSKKIDVVILGANMDFVPSREIILEKEKNPTLTLLFLAVDWDRKGGRIAFEALKHLHSMGIQAKLIVCGCIPPKEFSHSFMEVIPFLNKNIKEDHDRFIELLSTSHFLILPTRADCSLLVACESNAYGMPAITTATGGVADVVKDNVNGFCLPYQADGTKYAEIIAEIFNDKERYHQLILSSRKRFEEKLNWDKWAESFVKSYQLHVLKQQLIPEKNLEKESSN
jgi:glycosyltransferase involved in cell wall biosynthesis